MTTTLVTARPQRFPRLSQALLVVGVLLIGVALRVYQFPTVPAGLNQDELSAGYESWSLLLYGTDRWGYHLPAYFLSWGSGMNVLYSYLSIPFIAMFGLTAFAVRAVALLFGILMLPLLYVTVKRWAGAGQALAAMLVLAVMPWGWMTARWGLESNLLPFFLLLGVYTLGLALRDGSRSWQRVIALLPFAVALYAYGLGVLTILTLLLLVLVRYRQLMRQHWRDWLVALILAIIVAVPFLLFFLKAYVLKTSLPFEQWLPFTLPTLTETRLDQVGSAFNGYPPVFANLVLGVNGFQDGSIWNSLPGYATIPLVIIALAAFDIIVRLAQHVRGRTKPAPDLLDLWLLACLPLWLLLTLNVNQGNAIYLPLTIIGIRGGAKLLRAIPKRTPHRVVAACIAALIVIPSLLGYGYYVNGSYTAAASQTFNPDLGQALHVAVTTAGGKKLYITNNVPLAYVLTLWYMRIPAQTFQQANPTVNGSKNFGNFMFDATNPTLHDYYFLGFGRQQPNCTAYSMVRTVGQYSIGYSA